MRTSGRTSWPLRAAASELRERYLREGLWTDATLGQLVASGLAGKEDLAFAVHSKTRPWRGTLGEVHREARVFAASLEDRGVGAGDVVVFQLPNCREAAVAFWGAAYLGAVVVPVVHFYGAKELAYVLRVTQPGALITMHRFGSRSYTEEYAEACAPLLGGDSSWFVVDGPADDLPAAAEPFEPALLGRELAEPLAADPDAPALIAFTSGTTRDPKGVIHTHRTLGFEARQLQQLGGGPARPVLTGAPVGHFIGMLGSLLSPLLAADLPVNFIDVWDPAEVLRLMLAEDLYLAGGATFFVTSLLDHPDFTPAHLARMPLAGLGGSTVPPAVTKRLTDLGIAVYRSYGSTEMPSATGCSLDDPLDKRCGTDGRPMQGVELRLSEDGQILLRGAELFVGYTDPELTATVFDDNGWYRTGDVGVLDDEGYLSITDRISDIIIRGGENISAQEVEDLLMALDPIVEVSVVAAPDARLGEHAAAVLRVREGCTPPSLGDVQAHLAKVGLAKQKWPESLYAVQDFPRTPSGKVQKFRLRQQLREGALERTS